MSLGGVSNLGPSNNQHQAAGNQAGSNSEGKEFAMEKQSTGESSASAALATKDQLAKLRGKSSHIVDKSKKNRKGAPRTILVDGELYEVFLMAIA